MFKQIDNLSPYNEETVQHGLKWKLTDVLIAMIVLGILAYSLR